MVSNPAMNFRYTASRFYFIMYYYVVNVIIATPTMRKVNDCKKRKQ